MTSHVRSANRTFKIHKPDANERSKLQQDFYNTVLLMLGMGTLSCWIHKNVVV